LGLISNTMFRGEAHLEDLARFELDGYFDATLFSADENKWKPNRAPFEHIVAALAVEPGAAVYVGDDPANDVVGSQRAGLKAVHMLSSERFAVPAGTRPDATIRHLHELPAALNSWDDGC
jgi:putative hydrolase of the HAD superfamily